MAWNHCESRTIIIISCSTFLVYDPCRKIAMTWYKNYTKFAVYVPAEFIVAVMALQTISIAENRNSNLAIFVLWRSTLWVLYIRKRYAFYTALCWPFVMQVLLFFLSSACFPWIIRIIHDAFTIDHISCIWPDLWQQQNFAHPYSDNRRKYQWRLGVTLQPVTIQPKEITWTYMSVMTLIQKPTNWIHQQEHTI